MLFNCPLSSHKAQQLISTLTLNPKCNVIDLGCGEGEFLTRIQQTSGADCLGIDIDPSCITLANQKAKQHKLNEPHKQESKLRFVLSDIQKTPLEKNNYDLAVCIGSCHAFGQGEAAYTNTLKALRGLVKPNSLILIGEGYWKQTPNKDYLDFIGDPVGIYNTHEENIQQAEAIGFTPLYATTSSQDEWDHFEWSFLMKAEYSVINNPDSNTAKEKLNKIREWNRHYRKYGRTTMGFGFYLFMTP